MRYLGIGSLVVLAAVVTLGVAPASAQSCGEAWYQRNLIYKQSGYCFKTSRAIRAFGNAGCSYDAQEDVPLSARQRARVGELRALEQAMGCPP